MKKLACACGAQIDTAAQPAGTRVRCPKCKKLIAVPAPSGGTGRVGGTKTHSHGKKAPNKALIFGSAGGLVLLVVVLLFAMKDKEEPKPNPDDRAKKGATQILDAHGLTEDSKDPKAWLAAARDAKANGFQKQYEEWIERATKLAPEDESVVSQYQALVEAWISALDRKDPDFADHYFAIGERVEAAGVKKLAEDIYEQIAGDHLPERITKVRGCAPKHPRANQKLGRVLTDFGTWEPKDLWDEIKDKLSDMSKRDEILKGLSPWGKKAFFKREEIEKRGFKTKVMAEPPYLVAIQDSKKYAGDLVVEDYRKVVETLYKVFRAEYATKFQIESVFEGEAAEEVLPIIVYESSEVYHEQNPTAPDWAGGHFSHRTGEIEIYHKGAPDYETLFHEGTHQLVAAATRVLGGKRTNTHWLTEGIACYFECFKRDAQFQIHLGTGPQADQYLSEVQVFARGGSHLPFDMFVGRDYVTFMEQQEAITDPFKREAFVDLSYAQSWALVYFFRNHENGKYREKFDEYFKKELKGEATVEVFTQIFGDVKKLEKEWLDYIKNLKPGA